MQEDNSILKNEDNGIIRLGFYLNRVFSNLVDTLEDMLATRNIPVNHPQFEVMQLLWSVGEENVSQQKIANIIGRDKAAISRALTHLERLGYVERRRVSGTKNAISLTRKGREIQPVLTGILSDAIQKLCEPLNEAERRQLVTLLRQLL